MLCSTRAGARSSLVAHLRSFRRSSVGGALLCDAAGLECAVAPPLAALAVATSRSLRFVVMGHGVARAPCLSLDCRSRRYERRGTAVRGRVGLLVGVARARKRGLSPLTVRNSYPARSCSWFVWDSERAYLRVAASRFASVGSSIWLVVRDAAPRWRVGWSGLGVACTQARFCYTRRNGAPLASDDRFAWHDTRASLAIGRVTPV